MVIIWPASYLLLMGGFGFRIAVEFIDKIIHSISTQIAVGFWLYYAHEVPIRGTYVLGNPPVPEVHPGLSNLFKELPANVKKLDSPKQAPKQALIIAVRERIHSSVQRFTTRCPA